MIVRDYSNCSTAGLNKLDLQLIGQINRIAPGVLVRIDNLKSIKTGNACHPYLQAPAAQALIKAVNQRGKDLIINSCYRTIAQQAILFKHYQNSCACGIRAAARPGASNHNTGLSIDIEDAQGWRPYLEMQGWDWIGSFDPMHFDYEGAGCKDLKWLSIKAFQQVWNFNYPHQKIAEDGVWGVQTYHALLATPCSGFLRTPGQRAGLAIVPTEVKSTSMTSLKIGQQGESVKVLQLALRRKGFDIKIDGIFGADTETLIRSFQSRCGLADDGVVGMSTKKALGLV